MDLSTQPYQVLRYHTNAIRSVAYHLRYPLFASCSDDTSVVVSHGMVYNDLLQNPLIVPVKQLRGHTKYDDFGVMNIVWHPFQPWLFSAGADGYIKLWTWTLENKIDFGFVKGQNNLKSILLSLRHFQKQLSKKQNRCWSRVFFTQFPTLKFFFNKKSWKSKKRWPPSIQLLKLI